MFKLIGSIFRYSLLVVTILVLSHIIEIKGTSISRHVENAMHWVGGYSPKSEIDRVSRSVSSAVREHNEKIKDAEISAEDQKQLNEVIRHSK